MKHSLLKKCTPIITITKRSFIFGQPNITLLTRVQSEESTDTVVVPSAYLLSSRDLFVRGCRVQSMAHSVTLRIPRLKWILWLLAFMGVLCQISFRERTHDLRNSPLCFGCLRKLRGYFCHERPYWAGVSATTTTTTTTAPICNWAQRQLAMECGKFEISPCSFSPPPSVSYHHVLPWSVFRLLFPQFLLWGLS